MFKLKRECWRDLIVLALLAVLLTGCADPDPGVNIYCDIDSEVVAPLLDSFDRSNPKLEVKRVYSVAENNDSIEPPKDIDLIWSSNLPLIASMQASGSLVPVAADARVLIINTDLITEVADRPTSVAQLADPKWKNKCAIADPHRGAMATHLVALADNDLEGTKTWFGNVVSNAKILPTEKLVASTVAKGSLAWALTDSNSAVIEKQNGAPVEIVFPDQGIDQLGTLLVPAFVATPKISFHPNNAKILAKYLTSPETASRITMASGAQFNVRPGLPLSKYFKNAESLKWMESNFANMADRSVQLHKTLVQLLPEKPALPPEEEIQ